jgi:transposase
VDCDALAARYEARIKAFAMNNEDCKRLQKIPGVGSLTATAIVAHVGTAKHFKNGRAFAACIGLTPREHSSGGKQKLLGITKRGNSHIRQLLIQGARIITRYSLRKVSEQAEQRIRWVQELVVRRGKHVAAVALANKTARIIWALLARGEEYRPSFT